MARGVHARVRLEAALVVRMWDVRLALSVRMWDVRLALSVRMWDVRLALSVRMWDVRLALSVRMWDVRLALGVRMWDVRLALGVRMWDVRLAWCGQWGWGLTCPARLCACMGWHRWGPYLAALPREPGTVLEWSEQEVSGGEGGEAGR